MIRSLHAGSRGTGGFSLNVFSEDELEDIHLATLEVLQKTGVFVGDDEAMEIYEGAGAIVDRKTGVVKIPPHRGGHPVRALKIHSLRPHS